MTAAEEEADTTVLETRGIGVEFSIRGGVVARAVDGVDLAVRKGEIIALVGESGSGKTTLARTILGLQRPTSGAVYIAGEALSYRARDLKAYRRRAQLILQDPSGALNPRHTVYEAVAEGLRVHGLHDGEEAKVADALSRAGLRPPERFYLRYPHELSGGQRQRVVIAGALVLDPEIIVADEPVSSLDASVRGEILALLLRLRDELGLTLVVVTHDLGLAWNIADRVAVMYLGRIVEIGPTEVILSAPQHPYTKALLSVVPETERLEPIVLVGETPDPTRIPSGCRFHTRCPALADGTAADAGVDEQLPRRRTTRASCRGERRLPFQRLPSRRGGHGAVAVSGTLPQGLQPALDRHHYVDAASFRRESDMLRREWTCIGRLDDLGLARSGGVIPNRRAVVTYLGESVIVTADATGSLHAFANVCRHRGSQLVPVEAGAADRAVRREVVAMPVPLLDVRPRRPTDACPAHRRRRSRHLDIRAEGVGCRGLGWIPLAHRGFGGTGRRSTR